MIEDLTEVKMGIESDSTTVASLNTPTARSRSSGGAKMGGGGGHEQHTSSAPGLHGGHLPLSDILGYTQVSHWEVWQGV